MNAVRALGRILVAPLVAAPLMAAPLVTALLAGCSPPCGQVCRKILNQCELDSQRVAFDECEASCEAQETLYLEWDNEHLQDLFDDHKRCIARSSCEEIADGVCYEGYEELFVFDPDKELSEDPGT